MTKDTGFYRVIIESPCDKLQIYAFASTARNTHTGDHSTVCGALRLTGSEEEALVVGLSVTKERMLATEGWRNHSCIVTRVPQAWLSSNL